MKLKRSKDRKVANSLTPNGKTARIANSFGLRNVTSGPRLKNFAFTGTGTSSPQIMHSHGSM